ncbi:ODV-E27 [Operophtera brumata nucleopolyhedrovirus]|uniref:ODV-E27 n=1 Tax=Operophtera brumata nucleopolyhedrovirus TaxID=1046267 RepID=A0A2H4UZP0_9ABAC|nr:ODV-E27 [Operophtera brumata nucleopolyhedrovirus]AUA60240.1 ODV-E27 [Operophtera brumata nucleopolyhedrovirus]
MHCNDQIRTVTEIRDGPDKIVKNVDLAEINQKSKLAGDKYGQLKKKVKIAKYLSMITTLNIQDYLPAIFNNANGYENIVTIINATLGYVHNTVNRPVSSCFNTKIEYIVTHTRETSIPGEPIFFYRNAESAILYCFIDRLTISKLMTREIDVVTEIGDETVSSKNKLAEIFYKKGPPTRKRPRDYDDILQDINSLPELDVTQYVILLFLVEHAYKHFYILKNCEYYHYIKSLWDHSVFSGKISSCGAGSRLNNLLLSNINFKVEAPDTTSRKHRLIPCGSL